MSIKTQLHRSLAALPLLLVALLASQQVHEPVAAPATSAAMAGSLAASQLRLPLLAAPGACPLNRAAIGPTAVVLQLRIGRTEALPSRCRA